MGVKVVVKYIIIMVLSTVLLGSVIPFIQYLKYKTAPSKKEKRYFFSLELFDFNLDEDIDSWKKENPQSRIALADRGWVRKPMGCVMEEEAFEEKKQREYEIELP